MGLSLDYLKLRYNTYQKFSKLCSLLNAPSYNRILMYHNISDSYQKYDHYTVFRDQFYQQIDFLIKSNMHIAHFYEDNFDVAITFDDGFRDNLEIVAPYLEELKIPWTIFVASEHLNKGKWYLDSNHLKELSQFKYVEIGAHGHSHRPLAYLSDEEAYLELKNSKDILEQIIQKPIWSMSFPHGSFNHKTIRSALAVGFKYLCTSIPGNNNGSYPSLYFRESILEFDSLDDFKIKLAGGWDWLGLLNKSRLF